MSTTTVHRAEGAVAGWVHASGCANARCLRAIDQGRPWHAVPAGFAVTLPDYHYASLADAELALLALDEPARRPARDLDWSDVLADARRMEAELGE